MLITGMTGTGKTYLACALAQQACRKGHRAIYRRASRLFAELALARADGTYPRLLARIARADVLVLDDWAMAPITDAERRDLLEVLEDRYGSRSTIVTSQLAPKKWHEHIVDPTHADAICDGCGSFVTALVGSNSDGCGSFASRSTGAISIT